MPAQELCAAREVTKPLTSCSWNKWICLDLDASGNYLIKHEKYHHKELNIFNAGSPKFSIPFCLETLSKHLEYLGLCGDDTEAEDQILESLNGILLAFTEDS